MKKTTTKSYIRWLLQVILAKGTYWSYWVMSCAFFFTWLYVISVHLFQFLGRAFIHVPDFMISHQAKSDYFTSNLEKKWTNFHVNPITAEIFNLGGKMTECQSVWDFYPSISAATVAASIMTSHDCNFSLLLLLLLLLLYNKNAVPMCGWITECVLSVQ